MRTEPFRPKPAAGLAALLVALLLAVACGSDAVDDTSAATTEPPPGTDDPAPATTSTEPAADDTTAARFDDRGPWSVGTLDLDVAEGEPAMVFYPAATVPDDADPFTYSGVEVFGEELAAVLPGAFRDEQTVPDAWVEVPASQDGPFPVVLYSHGFGGYYRFSALHNAHVASHGYVVVAVDHPQRGLLASFGDAGIDAEASDVDQLFAALDLVEELTTDPASVLEGVADTTQVAAEGHSAGGRATGVAALDDRISAWIGQAPAPPVDRAALTGSLEEFDFDAWAADNTPPSVASLVIAADGDVAIPLAQVQEVYDWLAPPKWLVVLADAGHNAFTDICGPIQDEGGLAATVEALGLDPDAVPIVRLGEDGCTDQNPPAAESWAVIDHITVAFLDLVFDRDPAVAAASLDPAWIEQHHPGLVAEVQVEEG